MIVLTSMNPFEALADAFLADIARVEVLCTYFLIGAIAVIRLERVIENAGYPMGWKDRILVALGWPLALSIYVAHLIRSWLK